jgi:hypothetical protein
MVFGPAVTAIFVSRLIGARPDVSTVLAGVSLEMARPRLELDTTIFRDGDWMPSLDGDWMPEKSGVLHIARSQIARAQRRYPWIAVVAHGLSLRR